MVKQQFGGDWTADKLERLRKYLSAYTRVLSKQPFNIAYIDAFAGTGYRELKNTDDPENSFLTELADVEPQKFLEGSARIALECEPAFHKYVFIEKDDKKLSELRAYLYKEFPQKEGCIDFICGDANQIIQDLCKRDWRFRRAVLFLDPYGMQVAWKTIHDIARTEAIDLWILFPLGVAVNRMLPRDGNIDQNWHRKLDEIFGRDDWFKAFYEENSQTSLFGEEVKMQKTANFAIIMAYYVKRLKSVFNHVAENPLQLYNSRNNPLYGLFFAAGNPRGGKIAIRIAQHILGN
jgi:three-Cys-motif partner protein